MMHHIIFYQQIKVVLILGLILVSLKITAQDGEVLFKNNCAVCHQMGSRLVGPDLTGITEKRSEEWLISFIASSQTMIKNGDEEAVAIYEEFNQTAMPDQSHLDEAQIKSILGYIKDYTKKHNAQPKDQTADAQETENQEQTKVEYMDDEIATGKMLFTGSTSLANGGASCITCHNVANDEIISGGNLAKDLTTVYGRMGDAGVKGILSSPPFPAMAQSYKTNKLTEEEVTQLTAFLSEMNNVSGTQTAKSGNNVFFLGSSSGLVILLIIIALLWNKRKKKSVKHDIFSRQIKSI